MYNNKHIPSDALVYFNNALKSGDKNAYWGIGFIYYILARSNDDIELALWLFTKALQGSSDIAIKAANKIRKIIHSTRYIYREGFRALFEIDNRGLSDHKDQVLLAHYYNNGINTEVDRETAFMLYDANMHYIEESNESIYHYEYGKLLMLKGDDDEWYSYGIQELSAAMFMFSLDAKEELESLAKKKNAYAIRGLIWVYSKRRWNEPKQAVSLIKEYITFFPYDNEEMPPIMIQLSEYYF